MLKTFVNLMIVVLTAAVSADDCDLSQIDFPSSECSFNASTPSVNVQALKFGMINFVSESGEEIFLGANRYKIILGETNILDAGNATACNFDANTLSNTEIGEDVAFTVDSDDPRKITRLWLLRCSVYIPR